MGDSESDRVANALDDVQALYHELALLRSQRIDAALVTQLIHIGNEITKPTWVRQLEREWGLHT